MNVLFISPGFPREMPHFVRALAAVGVGVVGVGEQPEEALDPSVRRALAHYLPISGLWDEERAVAEICGAASRMRIDRVECLWEPGVILAARIREALELPGMTVEQTLPFRDKEKMKAVLDAAGIRTPRHAGASTEGEIWAAAERIGFPLIVKPIAGAGSADTHRVDGPEDLLRVVPLVRHVPEVSVEEFIDGEEFTFDTICSAGRVCYHNVAWYRPRPLIARSVEWISAQTVSLRRPDAPELACGVQMGRAVLRALGFRSGFTHMEWFRTEAGEAVFGEIACRPPGAMSVDIMNATGELDTYRGWAEAACLERFSQSVDRRYNAAVVFKRARGQGRILRIRGLERLVARYRPHIVEVNLLPVGAPRRNWKQTLLSDGYVVLRHPDLHSTLEIADRFGTDLSIEAG